MTERTGTIESYIEGPRWALPEGTIQKFILDCDARPIKLIYERRSTTLLRATIFFKVEGPEVYLIAFKKVLERTLDEYNGITREDA